MPTPSEATAILRALNEYVRSPLALLCIRAKQAGNPCPDVIEEARKRGSDLSLALQAVRDALGASA